MAQKLKFGADYSLSPIIPQTVKFGKKARIVAFISDVHIPFQDKKALASTFKLLHSIGPDVIYLGGDIIDNYYNSRFKPDVDRVGGLQAELDTLNKVLVQPLSQFDSTVIYQFGNHEVRTYHTINTVPGLSDLRGFAMKEMANLPDDWTVLQDQTMLQIGDLLYHHGKLASRDGGGARHLAFNRYQKLGCSNISGHNHRFDAYHYTNVYGASAASYTNGHLSNIIEARYINSPDWQSGISIVDYTANMKHFQVYQLIHTGQKFLWNGEEF